MADTGVQRTLRNRKSPTSGLAAIIVLAIIMGVGLKAWPTIKEIVNGNVKDAIEEVKVPLDALNPTSRKIVRDDKIRQRGQIGKDLITKQRKTSPTNQSRKKQVLEPTKPSADFVTNAKEARKKYRAFAWFEAEKLYRKAGMLSAPRKDVNAVNRKADKAHTFGIITKDIKPSVLSHASGLYDIHLRGGKVMRALVLDDGADSIQIEEENRKSMLPRRRVKRMVPVSEAKLLKEKEQILEDLLADAIVEKDNSIQIYAVAVKALELDLPKKAAEYLEMAYKKDPKLLQTVQELWARRLLKDAIWFMSRGITARAKRKFAELETKYSHTQTAAIGKELLAEAEHDKVIELASSKRSRIAHLKQEQINSLRRLERKKRQRKRAAEAKKKAASDAEVVMVQPEEPEQPNDEEEPPQRRGDKSEEELLADKTYNQGIDLANEGHSIDSQKKSTRLYQKALQYFLKSTSLYNQALQKDPGNDDLRVKLQDSKKQEYWARKLQRLH